MQVREFVICRQHAINDLQSERSKWSVEIKVRKFGMDKRYENEGKVKGRFQLCRLLDDTANVSESGVIILTLGSLFFPATSVENRQTK